MKIEKYPIDYDNNWKEVVSTMIEDFLAFFMPDLYADVNFSKPIDFLEQELYDIIQETDKDRMIDKLVRVQLKNGEDKWILIHIEFQTSGETLFSARMYHYYRLIRAKYNKNVTALVIYTGKAKPKLFDYYKEDNYGTSIVYRFNTYRIIKQNVTALLVNPNPFAIIVLANYYVLKSEANQKKRLNLKETVFDLARNRGYSDEKTSKILFFVNELMRLNQALDEEFKQHIFLNKKNLPDMFKYSQSTYDMVDVQTQGLYGTTVPEVLANAAETAALAQSAIEEVKKSVILLFKKFNLSAEEIATELGKDPQVVYNILFENNLISE
jgi:hypothetical protein